MPLVDFLFRCPECGHDPMEGVGDRASCPSCGRTFERGGEGGMIRIRETGSDFREVPGHLLAAIPDKESLLRRHQEGEEVLLEGQVRVRIASRERAVRYKGEVLGLSEVFGAEEWGSLRLTGQSLGLWPLKGGGPPRHQWSLMDIGAVQTSSSSLQISPRTGGVVSFRFPQDSLRRWEEALHHLLRLRYRTEGRGEILEFQPRIVTEWTGTEGNPNIRGPRGDPEGYRGSIWYAFFGGMGKVAVRLLSRLEVRGLDNIPRDGPFILVANHQSLLDPVFVQVVCPRPLHTLTKSTKFISALFGWWLPRVNGIPTRRYRVDSQAVRVVLRRLSQGEAVGIYPEGERSWDGYLQKPRRGTVRLLLGAGVPVVPCGIDGAYDVLPRWSHRIRRRQVVISFGAPLVWPKLASRGERERALPEAMETLTRRLGEMGAWTEKGGRNGGRAGKAS